MPIQITIIGLGQIGASFGLALAQDKGEIRRVGHDREATIARQAEKLGAVDKVAFNLPNSVKDADVVLLALPLNEIRDTLSYIAQDLKPNVVMMDTAPAKETVAAWVKELLPAGTAYVGLTPVLNPDYLHEAASGIEASHADLFNKGMMVIVSPPGTPSAALSLATGLIDKIGAGHMFADIAEVDGIMSATHILPQLLAAALVNSTVDAPGWREGRKLAGRVYADATIPAGQFEDPAALARAAVANRHNVARLLDAIVANLQVLRNDIEVEAQESLIKNLEIAHHGRRIWWKQRQTANWLTDEEPRPELPTSSQVFGRLFGLGRKPKDKK